MQPTLSHTPHWVRYRTSRGNQRQAMKKRLRLTGKPERRKKKEKTEVQCYSSSGETSFGAVGAPIVDFGDTELRFGIAGNRAESVFQPTVFVPPASRRSFFSGI